MLKKKMNSFKEILVIDDEEQIRNLLRIVLETNGYKVVEAETAKTGIQLAVNHSPSLIILDIGLPDKNGHEVLLDLRKWFSKPIIMLSVRDSEADIVKAIDNGANDYLVKPFRTGELLARIRAALRIVYPIDKNPVLVFNHLSIDLVAHTVKHKKELLKLTTTEFDMLSLLAINSGKVLTHQYILNKIWGAGHENDTQYLRVFIGQLRKKIEENPNNPKYIITESGIGYRFISID